MSKGKIREMFPGGNTSQGFSVTMITYYARKSSKDFLH